MTGARIPHKKQMKPLDSFRNTVKINQVEVYVTTTALCTRLAVIAKREIKKEDYFYYELTVKPTALFKNEMKKKLDKPSLRKALLKEKDIIGIDHIKHPFCIRWWCIVASSVLDQGNVFFRNWKITVKGLWYFTAIKTKSSEHSRRRGGDRCPDIDVDESNKVQVP